ncbi:MAG: YebC/PmpR family DNA-binding transcriptional regulator [Holosporales bacterium]|jgi:YebC/PmpR family DNA-binding regulatory protein|nr:YebC/PmpR family DNA-binding transcriptional regulator [Holosporales bacterium]
MSGHSQFKNIMYRKGAQDAKRAKVFTKVLREITVAVKTGGADKESNPQLRAAWISSREANMPKDTVERAIKKALGNDDTTTYQEMRYEGYGPAGSALIIESLTDNRNRTSAEVRSYFNKFGGAIGETNSVSYKFDHLGYLVFPKNDLSMEAVFDIALEVGAEDIVEIEDGFEIFCHLEKLGTVRDFCSTKLGEPQAARPLWKPKVLTPLPVEAGRTLLKLIDVLEDNDDVQTVTTDADFPPELLHDFE